jgi:teichuronic acid biosynthesis glycosyltransferase TuaC
MTLPPQHATRPPIRVLSVCCVYPTPLEPRRGTFVRSRLLAIAEHEQVEILAPVGLVQWGTRGARRFGASNPSQRSDDGIPVRHPRWLYPPNAGWANGPLLFLQLLPVLSGLRRRFRWEILDAHYGHPEGVAAALCALVFRCRYVVTLRGAELTHSRYRMRRALMRWSLRRADRVIALSDELRNLAIELGTSPERVLVVRNGVDGSVFFPTSRSAAREKLGIAPNLRIVLSVGRLVADKGHMCVLDAMKVLLDADPDLRLAIAGGPGREGSEFEHTLRTLVESPEWRGKVLMLGEIPQTELAQWMNAADLFCLGSLREGCPNVVVEALACGLPTVATRVGAVPELIPSEELGLVVPPSDPAALERALSRALGTAWDREAIGAWGQRRSWRQVAEELRTVFDSVKDHPQPGAEGDDWTYR